jgi:hypothetical protein
VSCLTDETRKVDKRIVIRHFGISVMVHLIQRGWPCGWLCLESMKCAVVGIFLKAAQCLSDRQFSHRPPIGLICPSGGILTGLSSLISDFPKNISVPTHPKSHLELFASHPTRGAYRDRHGRGVEGGGRGSVLRAMDRRAGWRKACERSTASGREMLLRTAKSCGPDAPTLASSSRS